jgi:signal transduction histidine kinase
MLSFLGRLFGRKARDHAFERAVRQVFDYLASETKQLDALESFVFQVEQMIARHPGPNPAFARVYLAWEDHLLTATPERFPNGHESLRRAVRARAQTDSLDREFRVVFEEPRDRAVLMLQIFFERLAASVLERFGETHLRSLVAELPEGFNALVAVGPSGVSTEKLAKSLRDDAAITVSEMVRRFKAAAGVLYARTEVLLGAETARAAIVEFIRELRATYTADMMQPVLAALPEHVLEDDEWLAQLSRGELERRVREQTKELEVLNRSLESKVEERTVELRQAYEELRAIDARKSEFISVAAHQLRTPLSGIRWALGMLGRGEAGALSAEQRKLIEQSEAAAAKLIAIVGDMLSTEFVRTGATRYAKAPVAIADLVEETLFSLADRIKERRISVKNHATDRNVRAFADRTAISQVVLNLIDNATKYTREGGEVRLSLRRGGEGKVEFGVEDTGIGIPEDEQRHVFERFFRASNAVRERADGSGLGLAIVKSIVEAHGGAIEFTSRAGEGTSFLIRLPSAEATPSPVVH